ncbi:regulator of microtubule dynamics protein 3-like [Brevipalpus obovatus]|uniref:regulator of microtubule dynamics protein 3-like n=1 Tax=Brevipalpus obovatus TaxID=246614 RepID=UPI003D9E387D
MSSAATASLVTPPTSQHSNIKVSEPSIKSTSPPAPETVPFPKYEEWLAEIDREAEDVNADKDKLVLKTKEGYEHFNGSDNAQILWRMGRNLYKAATVANAKGQRDREKSLLTEAEEYITKALAKDPESSVYHAWGAYISGKLSDFAGQKERIQRGHEIRHHLEEAIRLKTIDAGVYLTFGRWCIEVAKLTWVERKLAAALFSKPPEATYQEALDKFVEADKLKPDWKSNYFWMAKTHIAMKNYKKAIEALDIAIKCNPKDEEDLTVEEELISLQKKYASYR